MKNIALEVDNLSKQYRLGQVGTGTISHDLNRWWHKVRGKEDPYLKIGDANDRTKSGDSDYVWALRDINFQIEQGDAVGIIGRNGAGKSTLLKLLSKVTKPTLGEIKVKGRIASLLEVGTGFHPEMTGRENIYLNGAILGMTRREIKRKFDEIVDFAGVERYIDTPVKRYSSGMYVRLAFAVAAHLESEILIVDEVLAVGDAEFQKKCLGKMGDVSKGEGRTVLFVSHNIASVTALCNKGILLQNGTLFEEGNISNVISSYLDSGNSSSNHYISDSEFYENEITDVKILDQNERLVNNFYSHQRITVRIQFNCSIENIIHSEIGIRVKDFKERIVFTSQISVKDFDDNNGDYLIDCMIPENVLVPNSYKVQVALHIPNKIILSLKEDIVTFSIEETGTDFYMYEGVDYGCVFVNCKWENSNS
ncbi:ABC transporter ATP-binding protein [uncultured Sphingobacterium sp.]|uniref:ABC transporter ATP-binding protein n=1 Tax=uncultured Sphingobacterium sp. TaxID=182688 RepID=UPI0025FE5DE8|nr:ABC transporter ATP-binding protein [uncultured Sphingobacterium sp.]